MKVKNIIKKLILFSLILNLVVVFFGVYNFVYAKETKLSNESNKNSIIKSNDLNIKEKENILNKVNFYVPKVISHTGSVKWRLIDTLSFRNKINYIHKDSRLLGWSELKMLVQQGEWDEGDKLLFPIDYYKLDGTENINFNKEIINLYAVYSVNLTDQDGNFEDEGTVISNSEKKSNLIDLNMHCEAEILNDGRIKFFNFKLDYPLSYLSGDIYAKIDTKKLGINWDDFKNTVEYYMDGIRIPDVQLNDYFDSDNPLGFPKIQEFFMTQYDTDYPRDNELENLLRNDKKGSNDIKKKLYKVIRIPRKILLNSNKDKTYIAFKVFNGLPEGWKNKINLLKNIDFFGVEKSNSNSKLTYKLDKNMAEKLFNKRVKNGMITYDDYIDIKNTYENIKFEKFDIFQVEIAIRKDNSIKLLDKHIFLFKLFENYENSRNKIYSTKSGSHNIDKIDELVFDTGDVKDLKQEIFKHISNYIQGKILSGLMDDEYEIKSDDKVFDLFEIRHYDKNISYDDLIEKYENFFDTSNLSSNEIFEITLKANKDFLYNNYVPFEKDTWESDMNIKFNLVLSKPILEIQYKNKNLFNNEYIFWTMDLQNYSFEENIKVYEKNYQNQKEIKFKAVVIGNELDLYKSDNSNFKINKNPIKFVVKRFPADLIGNKSWYVLKTDIVSDEEILKHYKIKALDDRKYKLSIAENPMKEKGNNVKNGFLKLQIIRLSNTNLTLPESVYEINIPVYRDNKLESKFKTDTDESKYFNSSNPTLVNQIFYPLKYKLNPDKIRDRFLYATLLDKQVNIESVNKDGYFKSTDLVYNQIYAARDENVELENQATHTIKYIVNRNFTHKLFISGANTGNYILHKSKKQTITKEDLMKHILNLYQGKADILRLSTVDTKGKIIKLEDQEAAIKRFTENIDTNLKERIFVEGIKNGERVFVNQYILENVDDSFFISKEGNEDTENKDTKEKGKDDSFIGEAKSIISEYKLYFIIAGISFAGLVFLLVVLKIAFPSKKERKRKMIKIFKKYAYSEELSDKLSNFCISRKYKKNKVNDLVKTINLYLNKKIPEDEIIEIINNAVRNDYDTLDFTSL